MLSNLASYLLGYAEPTVPSPMDDSLRLTTVETEEDDWLIVERPEDTDENEDDEMERRSGSLPCLSLEESWFITPPPCFASTGPVRVETSPLENLLIEHPSMSVYTTQRALPPPEEQPPRARSLSPVPTPAHRHPAPPPSAHHYLRIQLLTAQKHLNTGTAPDPRTTKTTTDPTSIWGNPWVRNLMQDTTTVFPELFLLDQEYETRF